MAKARWFALGGIALAAAVALSVWGRREIEADEPAAVAGKPGALDPGVVCLRIQLGLKDQENTAWDGSLRVSPGRVLRLEPWRKGPQDKIEDAAWKLGTRPAPRFMGREQRGKTFPPNENGLIVTLADVADDSTVSVSTKQGDFEFKLAETPFGKRLMRLEGAADVVRIPASCPLVEAATEDDYPSAAVAPDGAVWVAYTAFTHGKDFARPARFGDQEPQDLSIFDQPTGGDRVWAVRIAGGKWSAPVPVTPGGEDLYKTAVAIDGQGRPWVFYSGQREGNFDLFASVHSDGKWSAPQRLTRDPGPDINPVAATDKQGRVWVAWQGFRGGNANILALRSQGDGFGEEIVVSDEPGKQ